MNLDKTSISNMHNLNFDKIDMNNIIFDIYKLDQNTVKFFIIVGRFFGATSDFDAIVEAGYHFDEIKQFVKEYNLKKNENRTAV